MKLRTVVLILIMNFILVSYGYPQTVQCSCDSCHGNPPVQDTKGGPYGLVGMGLGLGPSAGAHDHFTKLKQNLTCDNCHFGGMGMLSMIIDMKLQIGFDINGKPNPGAIYDGLTSLIDPAYSYQATNGTILTQNGSMKCSNVYCHGGGTGGTNNVGGTSKSITLNKINDPRPIAPSMSPAWNNLTPLGCDYCHGIGTSNGMPSYTSGKANSHQGHSQYSCKICHWATTHDNVSIFDVMKHHNGIYDVVPDSTFITGYGTPNNFTYTYDAGGGICSNIACHAGVSRTWGNGEGQIVYLSYKETNCFQVDFKAGGSAGYSGIPITYEWDFGDGITQAGPSSILPLTATHTYQVSGLGKHDYVVNFFHRDANYHPGEKKITVSLTINNYYSPVANKTVSISGKTATLTDKSYDPDYNKCGHVGPGSISITWGDGQITQEPIDLTSSPSNKVYTHTYLAAGTYTIHHCVTDNLGAIKCSIDTFVTVE